MLFLLKLLDENIIFPVRRRLIAKYLSPFLKESNKILDLGASDGRLAVEISKHIPSAEIVGVDTHVLPETYIPIKKYDGKHIPFPDKYFDCVIIIDVLHHDKDPQAILSEAARVSKKYILIKDHFWKNKIDFQILRILDYVGNKPYGVSLPYNYLKLPEWENIIKKSKLKIKRSKVIQLSPFDPAKHILYYLEKN